MSEIKDISKIKTYNDFVNQLQEIEKSSTDIVLSFYKYCWTRNHNSKDFKDLMLEELELAYAITVHKSQGSEYPIVIIPACSAASMLLSRNLLYTAVTRAEKMVIIVGREEIVDEMVANNRQTMRYTGLAEWLA